MKIWARIPGTLDSQWVDIEIGQRAMIWKFAGWCGYHTRGEKATLKRATKVNLIWVTDSGCEVKTKLDTLHTVGKAAKDRWNVSLDENKAVDVPCRISYWNSQKSCCEYK